MRRLFSRVPKFRNLWIGATAIASWSFISGNPSVIASSEAPAHDHYRLPSYQKNFESIDDKSNLLRKYPNTKTAVKLISNLMRKYNAVNVNNNDTSNRDKWEQQYTTQKYAPQLEKIRKYVNKEKIIQGFPGCSVTIIKDDTIIFNEGFGYTDIENDIPATADSMYRVASVSKALTSAAVGLLVQRGELELDTSIQEYLPDYEWTISEDTREEYDPNNIAPITIRNLANHTAGLRHYRNENNEFESPKPYRNCRAALRIFEDDPLLDPPNTNFHYSTYSYCIIGAIIEEITEQNFIDFMKEQIFDPLQLHTLKPEFHSDIIDDRVKQYRRGNKKPYRNRLITAPYVDCSNKWPGGGFVSTAADVAKFGYLLMSKDGTEILFNDGIKKEMLIQPMLSNGKLGRYAVGWMITRDYTDTVVEIGHSGGAVGGASYLLIRPQDDLVVALLCNLEESNPTTVARGISDIMCTQL